MERICIFNLRDAYKKPTIKRARYAATLLKKLVAKSAKIDINSIFISQDVNKLIWSSSIKKPIKKIKVKIITDEKGASVVLPEETKEIKEVKKGEEKKEVKEKEKEGAGEEKKEEKREEKEKPKFEQKIVEGASEK